MKSQLSLTVLVDNTTLIDRYFMGEPGLSFLLETRGKKILFDTGYSDAFLDNAGKMGISIRDLDAVVLSHGHLDHTGGLVPLASHLTEAKSIPFPTKFRILSPTPGVFTPGQSPHWRTLARSCVKQKCSGSSR